MTGGRVLYLAPNTQTQHTQQYAKNTYAYKPEWLHV